MGPSVWCFTIQYKDTFTIRHSRTHIEMWTSPSNIRSVLQKHFELNLTMKPIQFDGHNRKKVVIQMEYFS